MSQDRHDRLSEALHEALDLEGADQEAFLDALRLSDPDLIEEVDKLLGVDRDLETGFLSTPAVQDQGLLVADTVDEREAGESQAGPDSYLSEVVSMGNIGPYRLLKFLGAGGMGKVFLAKQEEPLRRTVALKLIRSGFLNEISKSRFEAERGVLAQLEHPNIGRILDAGTTEDGFPYFALEVVSGEPLTEYCDRRNLTIEERLEIMISVCRGVEHAHRKQIVHRDLKPSNILVAEIDGRPVPKVIDFGIAKSLDQARVESALEGDPKWVGTPAFMSPEALDGSGNIDTRTDVYSLGVLLYILLSGRRPFRSETLPGLLAQVVSEDPPRPSAWLATEFDSEAASEIADQRQVSLPKLRRRLRGDLDWILTRATARDPDQRYGSASALVDDIERHLQRLPVSARPSTTAYRLGKWAKRNRGAVIAAIFLTLVGVGLFVQALWTQSRTERLTRASEELTREIERIEWRLKVAHLLPEQDLTPELDSIRNGLQRLQGKIPGMYAGAQGPGQYALGRGALSLGELPEARLHLQEAWRLGHRRSEVALALGTTLGLLYEQRLDDIGRTTDRETRQILRLKAEQELRDPALDMLSQAQTDLTLPDLLAARMSFYRGDLETALTKSRSVMERRPSLYEAKFLEAQVLQRQSQAMEPSDPDAVTRLLTQAEAAVLEGLAVARSSPEGYLRLCGVRSRKLSHAVRVSEQQGIDALHADCLQACSTARKIHPGLTVTYLEEAMAWLNLMDVYVWDRRQDPSPAFAKLEESLQAFSSSSSEGRAYEAEIERILGMGEIRRSTHEERAGKDPRATMSAAIGHLEKAWGLEPGFYQVGVNLGLIYSLRGNYEMNRGNDPTEDYERSRRYLRATVVAEPERSMAYTYLAQTSLRGAQYQSSVGIDPIPWLDEADELLDQAKALAANRISVLTTSVATHLIRGKWNQKIGRDPTPDLRGSIDLAEHALEVHPSSSFSLLMRGQGFLEIARYQGLQGRDPAPEAEQSRKWYELGLEQLPDFPGPYAELASLALVEARYHLAMGNSPVAFAKKALKLCSRSLSLDYERVDALRMKGEAELIIALWQAERSGYRAGLFDQAEQALQKALAAKPHQAEQHLALARLSWSKSSARIGGNNASGKIAPGKTASRDGLEAEAARGIASAEEAYRLNPSLAEALAFKGALLSRILETEAEGRRLITQAIQQNENLAWTWREWQ